jgi:5-deoxy-glucuronate isomerase
MLAAVHYTAERAREGLSAAELGLKYISVHRLEVTQAEKPDVAPTGTEICLVVLEGPVSYRCTLEDGTTKDGKAETMDMVLLPPGSTARLETPSPGGYAVVMAYEAPSELGAEFYHIRFADVDADRGLHHVYGKAEQSSQRDVWNFIDSQHRCSRLMMGICEGRDGGWTAWPPHEHTAEREEVYVYFDMAGTFGIQCVYEDLSDPGAAVIVREGDVVSIPGGYHPNTGAPAGRIKYVYCMAATSPGARDFMDLRIQPEFGDKFE